MSTAEKLRAEGRSEGRSEGRTEGRTEGRIEALQRLLERRFGPLPVPVSTRLAGAGTAELDLWTDRLLEAPTLLAVFGDGPG